MFGAVHSLAVLNNTVDVYCSRAGFSATSLFFDVQVVDDVVITDNSFTLVAPEVTGIDFSATAASREVLPDVIISRNVIHLTSSSVFGIAATSTEGTLQIFDTITIADNEVWAFRPDSTVTAEGPGGVTLIQITSVHALSVSIANNTLGAVTANYSVPTDAIVVAPCSASVASVRGNTIIVIDSDITNPSLPSTMAGWKFRSDVFGSSYARAIYVVMQTDWTLDGGESRFEVVENEIYIQGGSKAAYGFYVDVRRVANCDYSNMSKSLGHRFHSIAISFL
jgi:hypothetical protein